MKIGHKPIIMNWKQRIAFALWTALVFVFLLWLFDYFTDDKLYSVNSLIFQGIFFGIFFGIGFPFIMSKFAKKIEVTINPDLEIDEIIEIEGPANLFRGIEGVGGKIFLTNKKMIFKSHKINIQKGQTNIDYQDIKQVVKRKSIKLINNKIRIITKANKTFDFIINERDVWYEKISERIT